MNFNLFLEFSCQSNYKLTLYGIDLREDPSKRDWGIWGGIVKKERIEHGNNAHREISK